MDERSAFDLFQAEGFHFAGLLLFPEFEIRRQRLAYRDPPHAFLAFGRANASIGRELLLNEDASVLDGDIGPRHPEGFCPSHVGVEHEHHACDVRVQFSIEQDVE